MATTQPGTAGRVQPGKLFRAPSAGAANSTMQRFRHDEASLDFLDCAELHLSPGGGFTETILPGRESLLVQWKGNSRVVVEGTGYVLATYDMLYVPLGSSYRIAAHNGPAALLQTSAPAENRHPVHHAGFAELSVRPERIRKLKGKDVCLVFDVTESADKLVAGYTFFQPYARSWPPHNHTDQEETYIFLKGKGSMEVYESEETLSFVHNVFEGDAVTIPYLNYHPVFSQEEPLEFLWCIAGERYWIGDKNKDFLSGTGGPMTTGEKK
jgi:mannose-6-phosphate isomerase-like protein (cupin superfamily)